jgi:cytochrome b6-f complex iron-sulfur subunit
MSNKDRYKEDVSRRDFLGLAAFGAAILASLSSFAGSLRFVKSNVYSEESLKFKIGKPENFPVGTTRKFDQKRVFIFSDNDGIYAISAVCTHLGCIVHSTDWGFQCPCHGSKFNKDGKVIAGPAPRNLPWHEISRHEDGSLLVDAGKDVKAGTKFIV